MRLLPIILALCSLTVQAQDTLYWIGSNHKEYIVQKSYDSYVWNTISTIAGTADSSYKVQIPGATNYYRVYADNDTSECILVYDVLAIKEDSVFHPAKVKLGIKIINEGNRLKVVAGSDRDELISYGLTDISGRVLRSGDWFIHKGLNSLYLPFNYARGIYLVFFQSGYENVVKKVVK